MKDAEIEGICELYARWRNGSLVCTEHNFDMLGQALENLLSRYDHDTERLHAAAITDYEIRRDVEDDGTPAWDVYEHVKGGSEYIETFPSRKLAVKYIRKELKWKGSIT